MKRLSVCLALLAIFLTVSPAFAYLYQEGFENGWIGDYAPGWDNEGYRHGEAPQAIMQQTNIAKSGNFGVKVIANAVPTGGEWMWWADVNYAIPSALMQKQYNPYMKISYYDEMAYTTPLARSGQLVTVPSWVVDKDWTDVQFGARMAKDDNYYYVNNLKGSSAPWVSTGVVRTAGWHDFMMQLSSSDGAIHYYIDGVAAGVSARNDYLDLGDAILSTVFNNPLSQWGANKPYAIFDNFEVGSTNPAPLLLLGSGLAGLGLLRGRKFFKR